MPEQGFDHKPMAAANTASVLSQLDQGIDLLVRPAGNVAVVDAAAGQKLTMEWIPGTWRCSGPIRRVRWCAWSPGRGRARA